MAVEATGSRYSRNTNFIIVLALIGAGAWFFYDGHYIEEFINDNTLTKINEAGEEVVTQKFNLTFNRTMGPVICGLGAIYFLAQALMLGTKLISADETDVTVKGGPKIPYSSILKIDKRDLEKKGILKIYYDVNGTEAVLKLSDRTYDHLGLLLDQIVAKTGAAPESAAKNNPA
ncbi:MAG: hypothetical protein K9M57_10000 [Phycisphaerae bacterium]|nr:hypothetical protein [Phycisphaerae bacterium]